MNARIRRAWTAFVTDPPVTEDVQAEPERDSSSGFMAALHRVAGVWPVIAFVTLLVPVLWLYMSAGGDANQIVAIGQHTSLYQLLDDFAPVMVVPVLGGAVLGAGVGLRVKLRRRVRVRDVGLLAVLLATLWLTGVVNRSGYLGLSTLALTLAVFAGRAFFTGDFGSSRWDVAWMAGALVLGAAGVVGLSYAPGIFPAAHIVTSETTVNGRVVDVTGGKVWALIDTDPKEGLVNTNLVLLPGTVETIEYCGLPTPRGLMNPGGCFATTDLVGPDPSP